MLCSCDPEQDERYQEMEERLWRVHHPNEPMPGMAANTNEDDDLVMEDAGRDLSHNARCPISGVEVRVRAWTFTLHTLSIWCPYTLMTIFLKFCCGVRLNLMMSLLSRGDWHILGLGTTGALYHTGCKCDGMKAA